MVFEFYSVFESAEYLLQLESPHLPYQGDDQQLPHSTKCPKQLTIDVVLVHILKINKIEH